MSIDIKQYIANAIAAFCKNILQNNRAEYGKQIISTLSGQLTENYGIGWGEKQFTHCLRSAETFS
jgi:hypothetical protein